MSRKLLKERNERVAARLVLPAGHTVVHFTAGKHAYHVLTRDLAGWHFVHAGRFQAKRARGQSGGAQFDPVPMTLCASQTSQLHQIPARYLRHLIVEGDQAHPLDAHADVLARTGTLLFAALRSRVERVLSRDGTHPARQLSRALRVRQRNEACAQREGSVWVLDGVGYVVQRAGDIHHLQGYLAPEEEWWVPPADLARVAVCLSA